MTQANHAHQEEHKPRRDAGSLQITERDIYTLSWVCEMGCISFDHLQSLLGRQAKAQTKLPGKLSISATREAITRWLSLRLVEEPRKVLSGFPTHIWLSRRGLTQLALPYVYFKPRPASIPHIYATNAVRLHLETYKLQTIWYPRRALMREAQQRPTPDAELQAKKLPIIAVQVIERPLVIDTDLRDELSTLSTLATRYTSVWYFLHAENTPLFRQALATSHQQQAERVTLYGLDTQQAPPAAEQSQQPSRNSTA
jgi:hypothetical protein